MGTNTPISRKVPVKNLNQSEPIQLSSRELSTRFMIDTCLQVFSTAGAVMSHWMRTPPGVNMFGMPEAAPAEVPPLTPAETETKIECENTLRAAANRIQKIMDDDDRWSLEFQKRTEKHFEDIAQRQRDVLDMQRKSAEEHLLATQEVSSPHFRYKPALCRLLDGNWLAYLGDINDLEHALVGVGPTAQIALEAFDGAFRGVLHPATQEWLIKREQNLETGAEDAPYPKTHELDQNANRHLDEPPAGGLQQPGDSHQDGQEPGCGGEQNPPTEPEPPIDGWVR